MKKFKSIITVAIALSAAAFISCSGDDDKGGGKGNWCYNEASGLKACTHIDMLAQAGATSCDELGGTLIENCTDKGLEYCYIEASGSCTAVNKGQCATMADLGAEVVDDCNDILEEPSKSSSSKDKDNSSSSGGIEPGEKNCLIEEEDTCYEGVSEAFCNREGGEIVASCDEIPELSSSSVQEIPLVKKNITLSVENPYADIDAGVVYKASNATSAANIKKIDILAFNGEEYIEAGKVYTPMVSDFFYDFNYIDYLGSEEVAIFSLGAGTDATAEVLKNAENISDIVPIMVMLSNIDLYDAIVEEIDITKDKAFLVVTTEEDLKFVVVTANTTTSVDLTIITVPQ